MTTEAQGQVDWQVLSDLCCLPGVSGHESGIRAYLDRQLAMCQQGTDPLGSGLYSLAGQSQSPLSLLFSTHMDEIGWVVRAIDEAGYVFIQEVGRSWSHTLLQQEVQVFTQDGRVYTGILAGPQVHSLSPEQRQQVVPMDRVYIDLGVDNRDQVTALGIEVGDWVCPVTTFQALANPDYLAAKAFDNRVSVALGVWTMQALAQGSCPNKVTLGATVQEEVGLRGARTVAQAVKPHIALAVDTCLAGDTPADHNPIKLGKGVSLTVADNMTVTHRGLLRYLEGICQREAIPYQLGCFLDGGTDAGNIHKSQTGILATTLSIPMRYMHTHRGILHRADVLAAYRLMVAVARDLTPAIYQQLLDQNYHYQV